MSVTAQRTAGTSANQQRIKFPTKVEPIKQSAYPYQDQVFTHLSQNKSLQARPGVVHFDGFNVNCTHRMKLKILNIALKREYLQILPPRSPYFKIRYTKQPQLLPGLSEDITIEFTPTEWRYYYDCIRIYCQNDDNILIPIHAYPIMGETFFPKYVDFGLCELMETKEKIIPLRCDLPVAFEYELAYIEPHPFFTVSPMKGIVPAHGEVNIHIAFTASDYINAMMKLSVYISQFGDVAPKECVLVGTVMPPKVDHSLSMTSGFSDSKMPLQKDMVQWSQRNKAAAGDGKRTKVRTVKARHASSSSPNEDEKADRANSYPIARILTQMPSALKTRELKSLMKAKLTTDMTAVSGIASHRLRERAEKEKAFLKRMAGLEEQRKNNKSHPQRAAQHMPESLKKVQALSNRHDSVGCGPGGTGTIMGDGTGGNTAPVEVNSSGGAGARSSLSPSYSSCHGSSGGAVVAGGSGGASAKREVQANERQGYIDAIQDDQSVLVSGGFKTIRIVRDANEALDSPATFDLIRNSVWTKRDQVVTRFIAAVRVCIGRLRLMKRLRLIKAFSRSVLEEGMDHLQRRKAVRSLYLQEHKAWKLKTSSQARAAVRVTHKKFRHTPDKSLEQSRITWFAFPIAVPRFDTSQLQAAGGISQRSLEGVNGAGVRDKHRHGHFKLKAQQVHKIRGYEPESYKDALNFIPDVDGRELDSGALDEAVARGDPLMNRNGWLQSTESKDDVHVMNERTEILQQPIPATILNDVELERRDIFNPKPATRAFFPDLYTENYEHYGLVSQTPAMQAAEKELAQEMAIWKTIPKENLGEIQNRRMLVDVWRPRYMDPLGDVLLPLTAPPLMHGPVEEDILIDDCDSEEEMFVDRADQAIPVQVQYPSPEDMAVILSRRPITTTAFNGDEEVDEIERSPKIWDIEATLNEVTRAPVGELKRSLDRCRKSLQDLCTNINLLQQ